MNIKLDKNSPIPVGVQISQQIKLFINSSQYKKGDKLPSINSLAQSLGVNKNTIVAVLKELENEGYIESHRGKGVFVKDCKAGGAMDPAFISRIDMVIKEAKNRGIGVNELVNLVNIRFSQDLPVRKPSILFMMGMSQKLVEANVKKLENSIEDANIEGLFLGSDLNHEKLDEAYSRVDLIAVPEITYGGIKGILPKDKTVVKTHINLKPLEELRKGIEKKSKIAVLGATQKIAQSMADIFIQSALFRPRMVMAFNEIEKNRKALKDMDSLICCLAARDIVEKSKLKELDIHYISEYIDDSDMEEIKQNLKLSTNIRTNV